MSHHFYPRCTFHKLIRCSTVPSKSPWCAFHIVHRYKHTFISLISNSQEITHFTSVDKMYYAVVQQSAHLVEGQDVFAQVQHSDVSGRPGSITRTARSTSYEPNLQNEKLKNFMSAVDGDDEFPMWTQKLSARTSPIFSKSWRLCSSNGTGTPSPSRPQAHSLWIIASTTTSGIIGGIKVTMPCISSRNNPEMLSKNING